MRITDFFRGSEIHEVSAKMLAVINEKLPANKLSESSRLPSVNEVSRVLETSISIAKIYQSRCNPGTFTRARLANNFKWGLKDQGYPVAFIELATESLVMEMAKSVVKDKRR